MIVNVSALPRDIHYLIVVNSENGIIFRDYIKQDVVIYPVSYRLLFVRTVRLLVVYFMRSLHYTVY